MDGSGAGAVILIQFVKLALLFALIAIVLSVAIGFVKKITCSNDTPFNSYEHFESDLDGQLVAIKKRISRIQTIKEQLESAIDALSETEDDTCNIMLQIEQVYIGNSSAPSNESEYELPVEMQKKLADRRKQRATKKWADSKLFYSAFNGNKPMLECFSASSDEVSVAEDDLLYEVNELDNLLQSPGVRAIEEKLIKTRASLGFNQYYLSKGMKTMMAESASAASEGFAIQLSGGDLLSKADELIGKAIEFYNQIMILKNEVDSQKAVANVMFKKGSGAVNGEFSEADKANAVANAQVGL